jgi:hypothetical protein
MPPPFLSASTLPIALVVTEGQVPARVATVLVCLIYGTYVKKHFGARYAAVPYGAAAVLGLDFIFRLFA